MATARIRSEPPLVVIVGPTASGKTSLAISLAKQYRGEIVCADSRTVYKGMDIGTAKPSEEEQAAALHWGIDLVEPGERFSAGQFKRYALEKIASIRSRSKLPILVGGTGLYVDGVVFDYDFQEAYDEDLRVKLNTMSVEELYEYCVKYNIKLPTDTRNKRHVIRAIEQKSINTKRRQVPIDNVIIVGIATNKLELYERIEKRSEQLFADNVVAEATILGKKYGWDSEAMTGNIYPIIHAYLKNEITLEQAVDEFATSDKQLAKRQMTWFRRNPHIEWVLLSEAESYIHTVVARE